MLRLHAQHVLRLTSLTASRAFNVVHLHLTHDWEAADRQSAKWVQWAEYAEAAAAASAAWPRLEAVRLKGLPMQRDDT
jgi:hypothetical protein